MWVAVATLIAVGAQIYLARQEIKLVSQDVKQNTEQFSEFLRRPRLVISVSAILQKVGPIGGQTFAIQPRVRARNVGNRVTHQIRSEVLIPLERMLDAVPPNDANVREVRGTKYLVWDDFCEGRIYPEAPPVSFNEIPGGVRNPVRLIDESRFTVLCRLYDEFGTYPKDDYGKVDVPENGWVDAR